MKKRTGLVDRLRELFAEPKPSSELAEPKRHEEDPLDPPMADASPKAVIIRIAPGALARVHARLEMECLGFEASWYRGIVIRLWGEHGCTPVLVTFDDGSTGKVEWGFTEGAGGAQA